MRRFEFRYCYLIPAERPHDVHQWRHGALDLRRLRRIHDRRRHLVSILPFIFTAKKLERLENYNKFYPFAKWISFLELLWMFGEIDRKFTLADNKWTKVGQMIVPRDDHFVLEVTGFSC